MQKVVPKLDKLKDELGYITNIENGLRLGLQQFTENHPGNILLLLTDGNINSGIKETNDMTTLVDKENVYGARIFTITFTS
mgnify:CR=1 FL=1